MNERRNAGQVIVLVRHCGAAPLHRVDVLLRDWARHPRILTGTVPSRMLRAPPAFRQGVRSAGLRADPVVVPNRERPGSYPSEP
jgi:hypothetical protein